MNAGERVQGLGRGEEKKRKGKEKKKKEGKRKYLLEFWSKN